jgi:hypothetical protein
LVYVGRSVSTPSTRDDYLFEGYDCPRFWFQLDADRNPPSSFPVAGRGLVHGVNREGDLCDARISIEELRSRITFTQREFKGFTRNEAFGCPEPIAPIIDDSSQ